MADKVSVKTVIVISFLCGIILILCACMGPVNIDLFLGEEQVQVIVESTKKKVIIDPDSDNFPSLIAGDKMISGLDPNKYYMIETEKDENDDPVATGYPKYAYGTGNLNISLGQITRVSGGSINGLKNDHTYKVREASFFSNTTPFDYNDGTFKNATVNNGAITIITSSATTINLINLLASYDNYEVMAVAVNPASLPPSSIFYLEKKTIGTGGSKVSSIALEGLGRTVDYVFYKADTPDAKFNVLRVVIPPVTINIPTILGVDAPVTGETPVTAITDNAQYSGSVTWTPLATTFASGTVYTARITLTAKAGYTLDGVGIDFFTVAGGTANNSANSGIISAVFPSTTGAVINITFSVTDSITITPSGTGASYDDFKTGGFKTFTLSGGTFTNIVWKLNGQNVGSGTVFTINASNIDTIAPDLTSGLNVIYVSGEIDGVPYNQAVFLTVTN